MSTPRFIISLIPVLLVAGAAWGRGEKNGIAPGAISLPAGPGSLEGLGDSFQPILNSGTAQYNLSFMLPAGMAGLTPSLGLSYDGGNGFGEAGVGWSIGPGCVRRQVDEGMPRYGESPDGRDLPDRFLGMEGEELVPLAGGCYLAKIERHFMRYRAVGSHWEAHTRGGVKLEFGLTPSARVTSADGTHTFAWCLERQTDLHGNVIEYIYERPSAEDARIYLVGIEYGSGAPPWPHRYRVLLGYEDRPDPYTDYRPGFKVRTARRLKQVDVLYDDALIRRYELEYLVGSQLSLLASVTMKGSDGSSALPPTQFTYSRFTPPDSGVPISAANAILVSRGDPAQSLDSPHTELIDLNADALPDLLLTGTDHLAYLNRGVMKESGTSSIQWEGPVSVAAAESRTLSYDLPSQRVHLADMSGDGLADFVVAGADDSVEYFPNDGRIAWGAGRLMSTEARPPPAPFGPQGRSVRTMDLSFNKRIDVVQSQEGALLSWYNQGDGTYTGPVITPAPTEGSRPIDFSEKGVFLADLNGDRIPDVAKITTHGVYGWPGSGYARFGARVYMPLPDRDLDDRPGGNLERARLEDITGDGLADLVAERARGADLWFWRNLGEGRLDASRVVVDLPASPDATAHWADINGNGTTDLIYADSHAADSRLSAVDIAALIGGAPHYNLLVSIENGYGRKTRIQYRTSTDFMVEAARVGHPWTRTVPFPLQMVESVRTSIGLDLDGYPDEGADGDEYVTKYVYRDGYQDPIEHQFRGFAFVKQILLGDERFGGSDAPTGVQRYAFHTGGPDGIDNDGDGLIDEEGDLWTGREEEPLKGVTLWTESSTLPDDPLGDGAFAPDSAVFQRSVSTWRVRDLAEGDHGALVALLGSSYATADDYGRAVRQSVQTQVDQYLIERGSGSARHLRSTSDVSPLGNVLFEWNHGEVSTSGDEIYTGFEYALAEPLWIMDRVARAYQTDGGADGAFVSETHNYYDGNPLEGLPLGELGARGVLHRTEALISKGAVPPLTERSFSIGDPRNPDGVVNTFRQQVDEFGNRVRVLDANGHERRIEYDPELHRFPMSETVVVGGGAADLVMGAVHDPRFGTVLSLTDFNGEQRNYTYDVFGRLDKELLPGDPTGSPTRRYVYELGSPVSSIRTVLRDNVGDAPNVSTRAFFDGMGRSLGIFETGGPVMRDVTLYNPRGLARKSFQPYAGGDGTWTLPPDASPASVSRYDAMGRAIATISPPDAHGVVAHTRTDFKPLETIAYDGEDASAGPHANTPRTLRSDGLGRLVEVQEIEALSEADRGTFITRYRYALPAQLAETEDALGNVKYARYDGLGRRLFLNDLDRGHQTFTYDGAGNLLRRMDALAQETVCTYDGADRLLTEDYLDDGHPLSRGRTPDVEYHYDAPHPDYPALSHQKGRLSWVEDLTGAEILGYNRFGDMETSVKRIEQLDASSRDYVSRLHNDNLGRAIQATFPDGGVVGYGYDARGLLREVPHFVEQIDYSPARTKSSCMLANGVLTGYVFDPRERLVRLTTQSTSATLQSLDFDYDQADNIIGILDGRPLPEGDPRVQTASFRVDDLYRLTESTGVYGTIRHEYDRIGNMAWQTSADIMDDDINLGLMMSGGAGGTSGRVGREADDPAGPHALTETDNGSRRRRYEYDDNGNMGSHDGESYVFDFADRLGRVVAPGRDIRYLYDYSGRRVIKRVDGAQTSYINGGAEERSGRLIKFVFADEGRCARVDGPVPAPPRVRQAIDLRPGWNLISFQVDPGATAPAEVLTSIDGAYAAVYGHDGTSYLRYVPGAQENTLAEMRPNLGYWLYMLAAGRLDLDGPLSEAPISVPAGVPMLVGFPGLASMAMTDASSTYPDMQSLWTLSAGAANWTVFHVNVADYVNSLEVTHSGQGYWLIASTDMMLRPPSAGPVYYYHADHLGSANVITDATGNLVSEFYSYPYGKLRHVHHEGDAFEPFYEFVDKERDSESGLFYFGARHYDAVLGRFITTDPMHGEGPASVLAQSAAEMNLYAYSLDNPLSWLDPDGNEAKHTIDVQDTADGRQVSYKVESTVYVYFDKSTDMYKWLHPRGKWDARRAEAVAGKLQREFEKRVPTETSHHWGTFSVNAKFKVVERRPDALNPPEEGWDSVTLLRFRRRTADEKSKGLWGECSPGEGSECWFGENPGRNAKNANIYVDRKGNLKHAGSGHFHEVLHGFGLSHAIALNKNKQTWGPEGVPDILGYGKTEGSGRLTREVQSEFVRQVLMRYGAQSQTLSGSHTWQTGDLWSEEIQALYDSVNP